jgi:hypothetical protein
MDDEDNGQTQTRVSIYDVLYSPRFIDIESLRGETLLWEYVRYIIWVGGGEARPYT